MGSIASHDIKALKEEFQLEYFVETGAFKGAAISHALQFGFKELFSSEIMRERFEEVQKKFYPVPNVHIYNSASTDFLNSIASLITGTRCLFWLDAHFVPSVTNGDQQISVPLEQELEIISKKPGFQDDVIIMDDLRIYKDGPFQNGNWIERKSFDVGDEKFIYRIMGNTHDIIELYNDTGYVICKPKGAS